MNPAGMFSTTCTIRVATAVTSASGGTSYTFADTTGVACSIQPRSAAESLSRGKQTSMVDAVGYFPIAYLASLKAPSQVTWSGKRYRVEGDARDVGGRGVYCTVDLVNERTGADS